MKYKLDDLLYDISTNLEQIDQFKGCALIGAVKDNVNYSLEQIRDDINSFLLDKS